jgi:hypothetical protein
MQKPDGHTYIGSEALDHLARMNVELLSELWIMRDRMAVLERLLIDKGVIADGAVDTFVPDQAFTDKIEKLRALIVENVIGAPYRHDLTVDQLKERAKAFATGGRA